MIPSDLYLLSKAQDKIEKAELEAPGILSSLP